jgi:hypothetical protein
MVFLLLNEEQIGVKKKLCKTLDSLKKALPIMITFKNKENTLAILLSRFMLVVENMKSQIEFYKS